MRYQISQALSLTGFMRGASTGLLLCFWATQSPAMSCTSSGELEPPLRADEFIHQAYSPASGVDRTTLFQVPASAPASNRVLVILLHGGGDHDREDLLSAMRETRWTELAEREGMVLAYPTGLKEPGVPEAAHNWNDGRLGTGIWAMPDHQNIDDVGYLGEVMDYAQRDLAVGDRIYVMGISNGGNMAFRLASEPSVSGRIRAMTTLLAQIPLDRASQPLAAIPTLMINGSADPVVPFRGGEIWTQLEMADGSPLGAPVYLGEVISNRATLRRVLRANGCGTEKTTQRLRNPVDDGTRVTSYRYCGAAGSVQSVLVAGGGHRWQGLGDNSPESVRPCFSLSLGGFDLTYYIDAGLTTLDGFNATDAAWRFFQRH